VSAERRPIVVVMMVCSLAAPAWTAGSEEHRDDGTRRFSLVIECFVEFELKVIVEVGKEVNACMGGPRGSVDVNSAVCGCVDANEIGVERVCTVWFQFRSPYSLSHESWVKTSTLGARVMPRTREAVIAKGTSLQEDD